MKKRERSARSPVRGYLAKHDVYKLSSEERALIEESKAQVRRGDFATEKEVEAAYRRFRG